ncbi:hypothetical protein CDD83_3136 [Cordyceps sp. RAO-2017]|nr:hypothetical protein CDD83_3136 [Cordyceps sp. RAO-2017]
MARPEQCVHNLPPPSWPALPLRSSGREARGKKGGPMSFVEADCCAAATPIWRSCVRKRRDGTSRAARPRGKACVRDIRRPVWLGKSLRDAVSSPTSASLGPETGKGAAAGWQQRPALASAPRPACAVGFGIKSRVGKTCVEFCVPEAMYVASSPTTRPRPAIKRRARDTAPKRRLSRTPTLPHPVGPHLDAPALRRRRVPAPRRPGLFPPVRFVQAFSTSGSPDSQVEDVLSASTPCMSRSRPRMAR